MVEIHYTVIVTAPDADKADRVIEARVFHDEELFDENGEPFEYSIDTEDGTTDEAGPDHRYGHPKKGARCSVCGHEEPGHRPLVRIDGRLTVGHRPVGGVCVDCLSEGLGHATHTYKS